MVKAEMTGNPAQIHPIYIQLDRFPANLFWISPGFGLWRVFDLTKHAAIPLAAAVRFSSSVLTLRSVTFWTCNHAPILAQILATPLENRDLCPPVSGTYVSVPNAPLCKSAYNSPVALKEMWYIFTKL